MFANFKRLRLGKRLFLIAATVIFLGLTAVKSVGAQENQSPILYFFTNDGCAPCLSVKPVIDTLTANGYPIKTLKAAEYPQFAQQLGVDRTPTVVLIAGNKIVGRHSGLIDGSTLQQWFEKFGVPAQPAFDRIRSEQENSLTDRRRSDSRQPQKDLAANQPTPGTKVVIDREVTNQDPARSSSSTFSSPTMIRGTSRPSSLAEQRALDATVRLKVEDSEGTSYATGTVIHTHGTESLVVTCGHVFRDSQGQGKISAEYDLYNQPKVASGRLVDYNAGAKDIAIVVIRTQVPLPAVPLADKSSLVRTGFDVFSIGCDHGEDPTIRHSQIKNRAAYDGSLKYDIFGRPVNGRSGGGLFTESGQLIGVCNAAAVEVDEGIYSALDTIYWQLASTGLEHLFDGDDNTMLASRSASPAVPTNSSTLVREPASSRRFAEVGVGQDQFASQLSEARSSQALAAQSNVGPSSFDRLPRSAQPSSVAAAQLSVRPRQPMAPIDNLGGVDSRQRTPVTWSQPYRQDNGDASREVVIMVRSKQNPQLAERIVIDDPTPELLEYLGNMQSQ